MLPLFLTNATTMLIGEHKCKRLNENEHTLAKLFGDALDPQNGNWKNVIRLGCGF